MLLCLASSLVTVVRQVRQTKTDNISTVYMPVSASLILICLRLHSIKAIFIAHDIPMMAF